MTRCYNLRADCSPIMDYLFNVAPAIAFRLETNYTLKWQLFLPEWNNREMLAFGRGVKIGGVAPFLFLSQKAEEKTGMEAGRGVGKRLTEKS